MDWAKTTTARGNEKNWRFVIWCDLYYIFDGTCGCRDTTNHNKTLKLCRICARLAFHYDLWHQNCRIFGVNLSTYVFHTFHLARRQHTDMCSRWCRVGRRWYIAYLHNLEYSVTTLRGLFYKHRLSVIPTWISNHISSKVWDEIT